VAELGLRQRHPRPRGPLALRARQRQRQRHTDPLAVRGLPPPNASPNGISQARVGPLQCPGVGGGASLRWSETGKPVEPACFCNILEPVMTLAPQFSAVDLSRAGVELA